MARVEAPRYQICRWSGVGLVKCKPTIWEKSPRVCGPCPGKATELARKAKKQKKEAAK